MLQEIRLEELTPSPTNPRKTFDQVKLEELARSIAEKGLIQPIVVRPIANARLNPQAVNPNTHNGLPHYEIVAGERRYRASKIAGVETVLCIVRDLDDLAVLECQTIENLQRDDLHPLEEADGYAALMMQASWDVQQIADKIGKSAKYVYDRIKLRQLIPAAREVFLSGEITAGHAILLARLNSEDQLRLVGDGQPGNRWRVDGLFQGEEIDEELDMDLDDPRKAISVRELEALINRTVRFRPEEVDLPNLFPETGAALAAAAEEELKVVKITYSHQLRPETRDEKERTYSRPSWKRADGGDDSESWEDPKASETCDHSVMGVVVAGPGRGDAFKVCVNKKKCRVHWPEDKKAGRSQLHSPSRAEIAERERRSREQAAKDERERVRFAKAAPKLLEALGEKLQKSDPLKLMNDYLKKHLQHRHVANAKGFERGSTLEDAVRWLVFQDASGSVTNKWSAPRWAPEALKPFKIDVEKIVAEVNKDAADDSAKPAEKKKGKGAPTRKAAKKAAPKAKAKKSQRKK